MEEININHDLYTHTAMQEYLVTSHSTAQHQHSSQMNKRNRHVMHNISNQSNATYPARLSRTIITKCVSKTLSLLFSSPVIVPSTVIRTLPRRRGRARPRARRCRRRSSRRSRRSASTTRPRLHRRGANSTRPGCGSPVAILRRDGGERVPEVLSFRFNAASPCCSCGCSFVGAFHETMELVRCATDAVLHVLAEGGGVNARLSCKVGFCYLDGERGHQYLTGT